VVAALMISTAVSYFLLALSLLATHVVIGYGVSIYGDIVIDRLMWFMQMLGYSWNDILAHRNLILAMASLIYACVGLLVVSILHSALRRDPPRPVLPQEPDVISVGVITASLMFAANSLAVLD
jgi:hypothetical protein